MPIVKSEISEYIFHNDDNGFSVVKLSNGTTAVGILPKLNSSESVELSGNWIKHPKFGLQFSIENFKVLYPSTKEGIINFLSSRVVKGIGERTANRIVKKFGEDTLDVLDNHIERLLELPGFGKKRIATIKKSWEELRGMRKVLMFFQDFGISTVQAVKIYKVYGNESINAVKNNPYRLTHDIWGVGFKTADDIAHSLGFSDDDPYRIKAGINYILSEASKKGHVYLPIENLIKSCSEILGYELGYNDEILNEMEADGEIIIENNNVYPAYFYRAEEAIEEKLRVLLLHDNKPVGSIKKLPAGLTAKFSDEQLDAVEKSLSEKVLILTGGPGTGKTETVRGIISIYEHYEKKIMLAAPTGRAAKRMTELIGKEAKTIHRLLEYNPTMEIFNFDEENPLEADLIVVDEISMIDTLLMHNLMKAINFSTTVIFVGDVDQLPSVGAGNVLRDMIDSRAIPVVRLTKIFRQAEESEIVLAAHAINNGIIPDFKNRKNSDIFFLHENDEQKVQETILDLCESRLPESFGFDSLADIQVLSPMHRGEAGVTELNKALQRGLNPLPVAMKKGGYEYKVGDKVMQIRNNYEKEVFNGDIGFILSIDDSKQEIKIDFSNKMILYSIAEMDEITLAYAMTVHKSQGSEYPCVILTLHNSHYVMLQRNLIYTAITRASKLMIIIGSKAALQKAIANNRVQNRYTSLFKH